MERRWQCSASSNSCGSSAPEPPNQSFRRAASPRTPRHSSALRAPSPYDRYWIRISALMLIPLSARVFAGGEVVRGNPRTGVSNCLFRSSSFSLPFGAAADHGIERDDELSHDRDDDDLGLL